MDTEILVVDRIKIGREFVAQLIRDGFDVKTAFWVKTKEDGLWFLYVATDLAEPGRTGEAYRRAYDSMVRFQETMGIQLNIGISDIKLIHTTNPIARSAIEMRNKWKPFVYREVMIGNLAADEVFFYPVSNQMRPEEIVLSVANLMNRKDKGAASQVKFADGTISSVFPVGLNVQASGEVRVTLIDSNTQNKREVNLAEITSIG